MSWHTLLSATLNTLVVMQTEAAPEEPSKWMNFVPILLIGFTVYFLMLRPSWKQAKTQQQMLSQLKKDDEVVTQSGLVGRIYSISDKVVVLEIAKDTRVKMLRTSITGPWNPANEKAPEKAV